MQKNKTNYIHINLGIRSFKHQLALSTTSLRCTAPRVWGASR